MCGNTDAAMDDYNQAIAADPKCDGAYNDRGRMQQARGDFAGAAADYKKALQLNASNAEACSNLSSVCTAQGKWADAIACADRAIKIDASFAQAYNNRGVAKYHSARFGRRHCRLRSRA